MKIRTRNSLIILIFPLLFTALGCRAPKGMEGKIILHHNKAIPESILEEARTALSFYPELKEVKINFQFKDDIKRSFMQAQPEIRNLFSGMDNRSYNVYISSSFPIEKEGLSMAAVPREVLVGWLGHELGHIMDYRDRTAVELILFGLRYITSPSYIKEVERAADTYAVRAGMSKYILATKEFILNHSQLSESYKQRIARLYLSPEDILVLVNKLKEDNEKPKKEGG